MMTMIATMTMKNKEYIPEKRQQVPKLLEKKYTKIVVAESRKVQKLVKKRVFKRLSYFKGLRKRELNLDAYGDVITETFSGIKVIIANDIGSPSLRRDITQHAVEVSANQKRQLREQLAGAISIDLFTAEPWLEARIEAFREENIALITKMNTEYLNRVETIVRVGIEQGSNIKQMATLIKSATVITTNRAKLIAVDQTQKFYGDLNRIRQTKLGIKEYVWKTALDERVRGNPGGRFPTAKPSHWSRENKRFKWSKPPDDGHPGAAVRCRCTASPVLKF